MRRRLELALWKLHLRRLSLWLHPENEPLWDFQEPRS